MSDQDPSERYIQLTGEPLHVAPWRARWMTPQGKASLLGSAFGAAAALASDGTASGIATLAAGMMAHKMAAAFRHYLCRKAMILHFNESADIICIDKNPDEYTPPTGEDNMKAARSVKEAYQSGLFTSVPLFIIAGGAMLSDIANAASGNQHSFVTIPGALATFTFLMSNALHDINQFRNFKKVVDLEWVITNTPAKQEAPDALPVFTPA